MTSDFLRKIQVAGPAVAALGVQTGGPGRPEKNAPPPLRLLKPG